VWKNSPSANIQGKENSCTGNDAMLHPRAPVLGEMAFSAQGDKIYGQHVTVCKTVCEFEPILRGGDCWFASPKGHHWGNLSKNIIQGGQC
jgi:hypothetical protein